MDSTSDKKLFLLDAYALIYRAYYALIRSPRVTSKGFNTSAIFGFCNTLDEILTKERPSHIGVCFDPKGGHTFRHDLYPLYKAQRDKQPEDITLSVPYIKQILEAYHIPVVEIEGFEADDVIGTLSRQAQERGFTTYMMTPDKDYGQLVTDSVLMYRPALRGEGFEIRGPQQVCERYGIQSPAQVIDLLALEGDASDNIPGCPGVGEKTASKLVAEWGSVENLIANTDKLKGALQKKIVENTDQILFSKQLVTIRTDVPLGDIDVDKMQRRDVDIERLKEIYRELEFRMFLKKLSAAPSAADNQSIAASSAPVSDSTQPSLFDFASQPTDAAADQPTVASASFNSVAHDFQLAGSASEVAEIVEKASGQPFIGVHINAIGDESMTASIAGIAIALSAEHAYYIDFTASNAAESIAMLQPLFEGLQPQVVANDVKQLILLLRRLGIVMENDYFDTSVAHYLIEPEGKHTPGVLSLKYLDYDLLPALDKKTTPTLGDNVNRQCELASVALRLRLPLLEAIEAADLKVLMTTIEFPLISVLAKMEWTGVRIDTADLNALSQSYSERLAAMEEECYKLAGVRFNISSPMQVGEVLFDRLALDPKAKKTKRGAYSTTEEVLEKLRNAHPVVGLILQIRALRKLLTTYINALPALVNPSTGRIHTSYNQTVTATGRISSTNPNLQNIPVRSDDGREIRRAFVADAGCELLAADYSQIELRLMADLSGDPSMIEAFHWGEDIHRATAAKIYHEDLADVTDTQRRNAKTANFGIIYGISAFGLSQRLGISRVEAKELIDGYFRSYPGVKTYMENAIEHARQTGFVKTVTGRRRYLSDINSRNAVVRGYAERNAINAPLQGSAADIIKLAMVRIQRRIESMNLKSRMILQVHDELVFNVAPGEMDSLRSMVVECMEGAYSGKIKMEVSVGTGTNWLQAH